MSSHRCLHTMPFSRRLSVVKFIYCWPGESTARWGISLRTTHTHTVRCVALAIIGQRHMANTRRQLVSSRANVCCRFLRPIAYLRSSHPKLTVRATGYLSVHRKMCRTFSAVCTRITNLWICLLCDAYFFLLFSLLLFIWILFDINSIYFKWISIKHQHENVQWERCCCCCRYTLWKILTNSSGRFDAIANQPRHDDIQSASHGHCYRRTQTTKWNERVH